MPCLKIQTNLPVSRTQETAVIDEIAGLLAREMSGKPIAGTLESSSRLQLADTNEPAAFVEIRSSQLPPQGRGLGNALAEVVHRHLGVPTARVYVKFVSSSADPQRRVA